MTGVTIYRLLAASVDFTHGLLMVVWGLGLPLLVWHRFRRLSRAYLWFAAGFVVVSFASNQLLDECFLTTLARHFWLAGGGYRDGVPFTVVFVSTVAGIRPTTREAVLAWEIAIFVTSVGTLFAWHKLRRTTPFAREPGKPLRAILKGLGTRTTLRSDEPASAARWPCAARTRRGRALGPALRRS